MIGGNELDYGLFNRHNDLHHLFVVHCSFLLSVQSKQYSATHHAAKTVSFWEFRPGMSSSTQKGAPSGSGNTERNPGRTDAYRTSVIR